MKLIQFFILPLCIALTIPAFAQTPDASETESAPVVLDETDASDAPAEAPENNGTPANNSNPTSGRTTPSTGGDQVIDEIVAVVGDNIVLRSDLESQRLQALEQGMSVEDDIYCFIMEELLFQKLLLHQADLDSVEVSEAQIEGEMDRRLRYFVSQLGSEEKLVEFYGKSMIEIKAELHDLLEDQLRAQQVQQSITADVKVTPSDVRTYFEAIPKDSLPLIGAEVEVAQIVRKPVVAQAERDKVILKLNNLKAEIEALPQAQQADKFGIKAVLHSMDPGSAKLMGVLGMTPRSSFVPEFSAAAFDLNPGEISQVVETDFGYHIIQMIERRGEEINCRHILIKPKINVAAMTGSQNFLDSIGNLIAIDTIAFETAASKFSDDIDSKNSNGLILNPYSGSSRWNMDEVEPSLFLSIDKMEVGEISKPVYYQTPEGAAYRLLRLNLRSKPHRANLKDDYQLLQNAALNEKKDEAIAEWIESRISSSYIHIDERYLGCTYDYQWQKAQ
jgi:peptidyl-prolyl cis-trans isomerase SurA